MMHRHLVRPVSRLNRLGQRTELRGGHCLPQVHRLEVERHRLSLSNDSTAATTKADFRAREERRLRPVADRTTTKALVGVGMSDRLGRQTIYDSASPAIPAVRGIAGGGPSAHVVARFVDSR